MKPRLIKIKAKKRKTELTFREQANEFEGKIHTISFIKIEYKQITDEEEITRITRKEEALELVKKWERERALILDTTCQHHVSGKIPETIRTLTNWATSVENYTSTPQLNAICTTTHTTLT